MAKKKSEPKTDKVASTGLALYSPEVAEFLHRITPPKFIDKHPFNGLNYVQVGYVRRCVEDLCAKLNAYWQYEVEEVGAQESLLKIKHIVVKGRLTLTFRKDGESIVREQYGGSDVKCYKDDHRTKPNWPMDLGNDYKSAASDAFKKCASSFGIAQDIFEPKVEKKFDEVRTEQQKQEAKDDISGSTPVTRGEPIETQATETPKPKNQPGKDDSDKISIKEISLIAKLLAQNEDIRGKVRQFMKKEFGSEMTTRLLWGQYRKLMDYIMALNPKNPPF